MYGFFAFSFLVCFFAAIFGLIAPQKAMFWSSKPTRLKAFGVYMLCGFLALAIAPEPPKTENKKSNDSISTDSNSRKGFFSRSPDNKKDTTQENVVNTDTTKNEKEGFFSRLFSRQNKKDTLEKPAPPKISEQTKIDSADYFYRSAIENLKNKKHKEVIILITKAMQLGKVTDSARFVRASALLATGKQAEAVGEIQTVRNYRSVPFLSELYEKANPIIKVKTGYCARCCDGTTSTSTGKGACSHHKGVCQTGIPIYSERRKYQD